MAFDPSTATLAEAPAFDPSTATLAEAPAFDPGSATLVDGEPDKKKFDPTTATDATSNALLQAKPEDWLKQLRATAGATGGDQPVPARQAADPNDPQPAGPWSTTLTGIGLPRPFPEKGEGAATQSLNAVMNLPVDFANFALSPSGVATGMVVPALPAVLQRLVALGFTLDQAKSAIQAPDWQSRLESMLGAGLTGLGVAHGAPKLAEGPALESAAAAPVPDVRTAPADNGTPLAAVETAAAAPPPTQSAPATGEVGSVPTAQIASRPDLMQFKQMDDTATGLNSADQITAPYDPLKAGNLLLWEPANPVEYGLTGDEKYIVANGHHRDAAARNQNIENQNAQILRESAGYSAGDTRALAAEANIADGKGTIYDQTKFIRNEAATHGPDAALERAGQIGARGRKAATIALAAEPDLYASFVNERITPDHAAAIAGAAPNDAALQRLGIDRAVKGDDPQQVGNFLQAVKVGTGDATGQQLDLFGADDSAMTAAINAGKRASAIQREIGEQIAAVAGAAKRPEKAAALGVNVTDPASVNAKLEQLQALRERARHWSADPQIRDIALQQLDLPASEAVKHLSENPPPVAAAVSAAPGAPPITEGQRPTTGVANRVLEAEAKAGHIDPIDAGAGMSWQEMVESGRAQLNSGANPAEIAARFKETGRLSADEFAVLRAERERLAMETNKAADAARANKNDRNAQRVLADARQAETAFVRDVVQPAKTATSDIFRGMQGEAPIDASTFEGMRRAFVDATGREPKPSEEARLTRRASEVRNAERAETAATDRLGKAIDKELPKSFVPQTLEDIRAEMAKMSAELTPCIV
jgi:hypothetical protein